MAKLSRLGDVSDHGGTIITASGDVTANAIGIARQGDLHACPIPGHGITAMNHTTGTVTWNVDGRAGINEGDTAGCGAKMIASSSNVSAS